MHLLTRSLFAVPFEWGRLAHACLVLAAAAAIGEVVLPAHGWGGLLARVGLVLLVPFILVVTGFLRTNERAAIAGITARFAR
jgi:hypothetical protein